MQKDKICDKIQEQENENENAKMTMMMMMGERCG
jgi:hypothetical protein